MRAWAQARYAKPSGRAAADRDLSARVGLSASFRACTLRTAACARGSSGAQACSGALPAWLRRRTAS
jgi:hypothetical protein